MDEGDDDYIDNLLGLCEMGGWPDEDTDPEFVVTSEKRAQETVEFTCDVHFDEKVFGGGCPDMPTIKSRTGSVLYTINLETRKLHGSTGV